MVERSGSPFVIFHLLLTLFVMTFISFLPTATPHHKKKKKKDKEEEETAASTSSSSWDQFKNLLSCKNNNASSQVHDPSSSSSSKYVNIRVVDHASNSSDCRSNVPQRRRKAKIVKESTTLARSSHGMQLRKLSGCYECRAIDAEPASRRYPRPRTLCPCNDCGEVFTKPESLEHHQALRHAVSELGPDDSGRNIVEMIFKSSWQKKDTASVCKIERILKVHNTPRTAARFEGYREWVKSRALLRPRRNPRCAADGNELLRFHCTSLSCPLGASSSTSLCLTASTSSSSWNTNTNLSCDVCTIIRYGFSRAPSTGPRGIRTTASSGGAHDCGPPRDEGCGDVVGASRRAMLVCRVIAGRVRRRGGEDQEGPGQFDSVAGEGVVESYGNLEELFVANPRAILPCFVVIYRIMD